MPNDKSVQMYGMTFPPEVTPATVELVAFHQNRLPENGGLGRYEHLHRAIDLCFNLPMRLASEARKAHYDPRKHDALIWNEWSELMLQTFSENEWTTVTGPHSSWKTSCAAGYVYASYLSSPKDTAIVLTSTTLDGLRRRIWKEINRYYRILPIGNLVQSRNCIQFIKGNDDAGLFGIAVDQSGDVQKAVNKIIGFHNKNVIALVDEMQTTNDAIVKACVSLESGAERFQFIGLGNAESELDPHGQMSEPLAGWGSISDESEQWLTKRGVCVHLDGLQCPRIKEGAEFYPGMLRQRDIDSTIRDYGEDSPEFWKGRRGFWAPQGVTKTVVSSTMIKKFHAMEKATWVGDFKLGAALDPAFEGGDRCILRIGKCGMFDGGTVGIEFGKIVTIKISASAEEPIHYQIARQVRDVCDNLGIGPDYFAMDSTGEGGGLASILMREWSPRIIQVEFGGSCSIRPISDINPRPANQEYLYRVTELWYGFRNMLHNDQIRGLDVETATEFCQRRYEMRGNLRMVESKSEMKKRTKKSPDLADAAVVMCELFKQKERLTIGEQSERNPDARWQKFAKENDLHSDENAYLVA